MSFTLIDLTVTLKTKEGEEYEYDVIASGVADAVSQARSLAKADDIGDVEVSDVCKSKN